MLSRIEIRNFAIIQSLDLDWSKGMTVITGETGAGKSIVIDALGLVLGERVDANVIYPNAKQAEVTAIFELADNSAASLWLKDNELAEEGDCVLRRVISKEGRNKAYINGRSATQSQLKAIGSLLVDIHGQHAHQSLLKNKEQMNLLDRYANHQNLLNAVKQAANNIKQIEKRKQELNQQKQARDAQRELLTYQVEELEMANPEQSVLDSLESEHKKAATSQDRLIFCETGLNYLSGEQGGSALETTANAIEQISQLKSLDNNAENALEILLQAESLLQEAKAELSQYQQNLDCDPQELQRLDEQLGQFHDLARKHHVSLTELPAHFEKLASELKQLHADDSELEATQTQYMEAIAHYNKQALKLSQSRTKTAKQLQDKITKSIQHLAMDGGKFEIALHAIEQDYSASGAETIEFLVSANPGQPLQPLNKVASGGELSRISLSIAVVTAAEQLVPVLIFDEVDVGIGGGTAEVVGKLLNKLAKQRQVISVTHQPQVAACGDNHLLASKTKQQNATHTQMISLNRQQRIDELARMLGGIEISAKTLSHAKEMLEAS